jgi:predicted nucleic acid-binding protein
MKDTVSDGGVCPRRIRCNCMVFPGDPIEETPYARSILNELAVNDAIVPEIWAFEIANSIFISYSKRKRITEQQIQEYLDLLKALPIRVEPYGLWSTVDLQSVARRLELAAYDVAYLDLALRTNLPLAPRRKEMNKAKVYLGPFPEGRSGVIASFMLGGPSSALSRGQSGHLAVG